MSIHNQMRNESQPINKLNLKDHNKELSFMEMDVIKEYSDKIGAVRTHTTLNCCECVTMSSDAISVFIRVSTVSEERQVLVSKKQFNNHSYMWTTKIDQIKTFLTEG